jgi:hypothetical protein
MRRRKTNGEGLFKAKAMMRWTLGATARVAVVFYRVYLIQY